MRILGVGGPELVVIVLLGYIVLGPQRSKEVALKTGRLLRTITRSEWFADFSRMAREIRDLPNTLIRLAELEDTQAELEKNLSGIRADIDFGIDGTGKQDTVARDPWGIQNAVARTVLPSQRGLPDQPDKAQDAESVTTDMEANGKPTSSEDTVENQESTEGS